ncbi:MAG: hypothetical protein ACTHNN_09945 [Xanthobacteraceae bacterium]
MLGLQQPFRKFGLEFGIRQNAIAIDLVFQRRLVEPSRGPIVTKNLHQVVCAESACLRLRLMSDLQIQLDPDQLRWLKHRKRPVRFSQTADKRGSRLHFIPHRQPSPRDLGADGRMRCSGIGWICRGQDNVQGHWQTNRFVRSRFGSHQPVDQPYLAAGLR